MIENVRKFKQALQENRELADQFTEELKHIVPLLSEFPALLDNLRDISAMGYPSILLFLLIGMILTMVVQASSAAFAIALLMCVNGWITFEMGCALVLGSNIGTCMPPLLAALSANTMAKRAALGHLLFNVLGMIWALAIYYYFCNFITSICISIGFGDPHEPSLSALGLAMFHTVFNLISLCIMLPLVKLFVNVISRIIPDKDGHDESFRLQYINSGFMTPSAEMSLVQVQKETLRYGEEVYKMFGIMKTMLDERNGLERQNETNLRIRHLEEDSDRAELEIAQFLNSISPKTLSYSGEQLTRNLYKEVDELESIADCISHMSMVIFQKAEQRVRFNSEMNTSIVRMMTLIDTALVHMLKVLDMEEVSPSILNKAYNHEDEINNTPSTARKSIIIRTPISCSSSMSARKSEIM